MRRLITFTLFLLIATDALARGGAGYCDSACRLAEIGMLKFFASVVAIGAAAWWLLGWWSKDQEAKDIAPVFGIVAALAVLMMLVGAIPFLMIWAGLTLAISFVISIATGRDHIELSSVFAAAIMVVAWAKTRWG